MACPLHCRYHSVQLIDVHDGGRPHAIIVLDDYLVLKAKYCNPAAHAGSTKMDGGVTGRLSHTITHTTTQSSQMQWQETCGWTEISALMHCD